MEELFNELISIVTDRLSDLTDTINIDDIMYNTLKMEMVWLIMQK